MVTVPVGISNRHVHLSEADARRLFGEDFALTPVKYLSQPWQYAAAEAVTVAGPRGTIERVRVIGPLRGETQVELLVGDAVRIGIPVDIRLSGETDGTPGVTLVGPAGEVRTDRGVIVAGRHLHASPAEAAALGIADGQLLRCRVGTRRALVLENVVVRVSPTAALDLHIDREEANAAGAEEGDTAEILF